MSSIYRRQIPIDDDPDPASTPTAAEEEQPNRDARLEELERQLVAIRERDNLYREFQEFQEKVDAEIKRNVRNFGLGSIIFVIITLFGIFAASFGIYQFTSSLALSRLDAEFSEPNIQKLIQEAAETRAANIITEQVSPAVKEAQQTIANQETQLRKDVEAIRTEYRQELEALKREVAYQKQLREIQQLQNVAIANDEYKAFEALIKFTSEDKDLEIAARSAMLSVKVFYVLWQAGFQQRIWNIPRRWKVHRGQRLHTFGLITTLHHEKGWQEWPVRARAAFLLRQRNECGIPETLLTAMHSDDSISVRRNALQSFEKITRFNSPDVFGFDQAHAWYEEHRDEVRARLKCDEAEKAKGEEANPLPK